MEQTKFNVRTLVFMLFILCCLFVAKVSWNISFGRKYETMQKRVNNEDSNAGFEVEAVYGDLTFESPKADEQRAIYVARMKKSRNKEFNESKG